MKIITYAVSARIKKNRTKIPGMSKLTLYLNGKTLEEASLNASDPAFDTTLVVEMTDASMLVLSCLYEDDVYLLTFGEPGTFYMHRVKYKNGEFTAMVYDNTLWAVQKFCGALT